MRPGSLPDRSHLACLCPVCILRPVNYLTSARAAIFASLIRDNGVVTRRDEPQSTVEAVPLRPSGGHTPRSTASSTAVPMTARSAGLPPRQRPTRPPRDRLLRSPSPASGRSQAPRPPCTAAAESSNPHNVALVARGFVHGRFPYAGPCPDAPPAMAGIRKLHHPGRCRASVRFSKADINAGDIPPVIVDRKQTNGEHCPTAAGPKRKSARWLKRPCRSPTHIKGRPA
jgi:hypothetical protein